MVTKKLQYLRLIFLLVLYDCICLYRLASGFFFMIGSRTLGFGCKWYGRFFSSDSWISCLRLTIVKRSFNYAIATMFNCSSE